MAAMASGLVVAGYELPELSAGLINTASPLDNHEKSVAASAASRIAVLNTFPLDSLAIPVKKTDVSAPSRVRVFKATASVSAFVTPNGNSVDARLTADVFKNVLLFITTNPHFNDSHLSRKKTKPITL